MSEIVIEAKQLTKQYKRQKAVDDVSFQIRKGMICGLIGPNGAGKTTIMKMLGGLVLPTSGSFSIFGGSTEKELAHSRSRMSFMIEIPYAKEEMSARENLEKLRLQKGIPDPKRIDEVLELVGLADAGKKHVKKFSLGMRQRLGLAGALLSKPEIMVLDEPVNGLDPEGIIEIRELLRKFNEEENVTILISSHILAELSQLCTDYLFIRNGQIRQFASAEELHKICGEYYHIHTDNDSVALAVLQNQLGIQNCDVMKDGSLRLFEKLDALPLISKTLYENGLVPVTLHMHEADLESYYMKLVGDDNAEHSEGNAAADRS
ncbi:MAG: ABC transporter ATP-binding protein [Oscillospiraceae bacterium]|nr:ABC transporter ATP-binding protein [Oscillospiraceae bacterium]